MKTGAKHREQNQELENNAPHRACLAEQYSISNHPTCPAPAMEHAEVMQSLQTLKLVHERLAVIELSLPSIVATESSSISVIGKTLLAEIVVAIDELLRITGRRRGGLAADYRVIEALGGHTMCIGDRK